jgi:ribonuclease P protein component
VLPAAHRLRRSVDFERTVRRGTRAGRPTVVVHLLADAEESGPPQVGFVVSKAVGNAVRRNLVKRRLRSAAGKQLTTLPPGARAVVRALPASADSTYLKLERDVAGGLGRALERARSSGEGAAVPSSGPRSGGTR